MLYNVQEHVVPATHIREYHGSTLNSQEEVLQLAVKQYTPKEQPNPLPSDAVTFIACHGTGVAKVRITERTVKPTHIKRKSTNLCGMTCWNSLEPAALPSVVSG